MAFKHFDLKAFKILMVLLLFVDCKEEKSSSNIPISKPEDVEQIDLKFAKGFNILSQADFDILEINSPWPKSEKKFRYALIPREKAPTITLNRDEFDGILLTPLEQVVVTSTTHIPSMELLGIEETLIGFPGTDYISSEKTRSLITKGKVRELGQNESINTEVLLELDPDAVIAFGVDGGSKSLDLIRNSKIPVIYNGDWAENSPLAKAEWIKFFGALFNKKAKADSIFNTIEQNYSKALELVKNIDSKPTVLSGALHNDVWYMPNGKSPEATFLNDAGFNYLWSDTTGNGSLALSYEVVFEKAKDADFWINPSYYTSKNSMKIASDLYTNFKAFEENDIYTFANTKGSTGGVIYYELGLARPDLVLKDLIKIAHPEKLPDYQMTFFQKLE